MVFKNKLCQSGVEKLTRSSLKGVSNRALFAYKNGCFASRFLFLGIGFLEASKKANLSFKIGCTRKGSYGNAAF